MIADADRTLVLEVVSPRFATGVMYDHGRLAALHNMYSHRIRAAERKDLRLAAPRARVANGRAVARIFARTNNARLGGTAAVLALDARQERRKVLRVREHVCGCCVSRIDIVRLVLWEEVEERQLVCDCGEKTVAIWVDLRFVCGVSTAKNDG